MPRLTLLKDFQGFRKVLVFNTPEFAAAGRHYIIICTEKRGAEWIYTIKNALTEQYGEVTEDALMRWPIEGLVDETKGGAK
jgi:hypothetical protein